MYVLYVLLKAVILSLNVLSWMIVIEALLSWFLDPFHPLRTFLSHFVEPVVSPFRRLTSRLNTSGFPVDFSPLLAYITIMIVIQILEYFNRLVYIRLFIP